MDANIAVTSSTIPARILVTGCSSGIGRALVTELMGRGHYVIASARRVETLADLACSEKIELDVCSQESIDAAVPKLGEIDMLVNNAGIGMWGPVETVDIAAAQRLFDTNFFGAMRMAKAVLPAMRERRQGCIFQISSAAGRITSPLVGYYSASKHALEAASEALRLELSAFGVRVTCISLGAVSSELAGNRFNFDAPAYAKVTAHFRARLMAKRSTPATSAQAAAAIADIMEKKGEAFRYDATEDSPVLVADRQRLSDAEFEMQMLSGLTL